MGISLAAARVNAKMSQKALAQAFGVTETTVRNWESGRQIIPADYLRKLSELSGVPESEIFLPSRYEKIGQKKPERGD